MRGFKIETVEDCPVTRGSSGVLTMQPEHISMIAGAVRDQIEWMVLLHGERSADGYEVKVDRFTVPPQYRSGAEVELADEDFVLPDDCVGVMHSHHSMRAFFSRTDDTELNPRFPSSIVVAIAANNLGFDYRACGKVTLPCGALGLVDFELAVDGSDRFTAEPVKARHGDLAKDGLKGCTHRSYVAHPDNEYLAVDQTACGLTVNQVIERPLVFGTAGAEQLLAVVRDQTKQRVDRRLPLHYTGSNQTGYRSGDYRFLDDTDDKASKKGKRGKKGKRNGLVKLERPDAAKETLDLDRRGYSVTGTCDDCREDRVNIYWHPDSQCWVCGKCWEEVEKVWDGSTEDQSSDERIVVTDQIDMNEFEGWGI